MFKELLQKVIQAKTEEELSEVERQLEKIKNVKISYADVIISLLEKVAQIYGCEVVAKYVPYVSNRKVSFPKVEPVFSLIDRNFISGCLDVYKQKDFVYCILKKLSDVNPAIKSIFEDYAEKNKTTVVFITNLIKEKHKKKEDENKKK